MNRKNSMRLIALTNFLVLILIAITNFGIPSNEIIITYVSPEPKVEASQISAEAKTPFTVDQLEDEETILEENTEFPININTASKNQLMEIPRIGDVMSDRIIDYRSQIGGYSEIGQLMEVKGIAEKTFLEISAYLYV